MATAKFPRRQSQRRLGLTSQSLGYNLLQTLPLACEARILTEDEINAPPRESSDEQSISAPDSDDDFADYDRLKKKPRILVNNLHDESGNRQPASSALPVAPSNIAATTYHVTGRPSLNAIGHSRSSQGPEEEEDDGNDDLKRMKAITKHYENRRSYSFQASNIHTTAAGKENRLPSIHRDIKKSFSSKMAPKRKRKIIVPYCEPELIAMSVANGTKRAKRISSNKSRKTPLSNSNSPRKQRSSRPRFNPPLQSPSSPCQTPKSSPSAFKRPPMFTRSSNDSRRKQACVVFQQPSVTTDCIDSDDTDFLNSSLSQRAQTPVFDVDDKERSSPISILSATPERSDWTSPREVKSFTVMKACPMCNSLVDKIFMEEHLPTKRPTVKEQTKFCKTHRLKDAHDAWIRNGYPTDIKWTKFDAKLRRHHPDIKAILKSQRPSFYRDAFAKHIASGQNRTLQQQLARETDIEGLSSGYYGSKGTKLITQNILHAFSPMLRRLAATDKLIVDGGVSGYIQAVLAPEMAVLLVQEDMRVDEERAREILRESEAIGNLVNEEEDEVVLGGDDEEKEE